MDLSKMITTGAAARRIGVSITYLKQLIRDERIHADWTPLGYLVDPESVEVFIQAREARRRQREGDDGGAALSDTQLRKNELAYPTVQ